MAKSNNERQAKYRRNHEMQYRLNMILDHDYGWKVRVLARRYAVTNKAILEQAITALFRDATEGMTESEAEAFFDMDD